MSEYRAPRALARNHGASGVGTGAFFAERVTALALIPMGIWLLLELIGLSRGGVSLAEARGWLSSPVIGGLMVVFLVTAMVHAYVCARVLLEDYVKPEELKLLAVVGVMGLVVLLGTVGVFSVLSVMFTI